jgi:hypothetical protein
MAAAPIQEVYDRQKFAALQCPSRGVNRWWETRKIAVFFACF